MTAAETLSLLLFHTVYGILYARSLKNKYLMTETLTSTSINHRLDATEMVSSVVSLPEYKRSRDEGYNVSRSIARAALQQTGMPRSMNQLKSDIEDTYEPSLENASVDTIRYALIGELPSFVHGLEGIRAFHESNVVNRESYITMKGRAARFNHAVKAMIEQDDSLDFNDIKDAVTTLYGVLNRERWVDDRAGYETEVKWFTSQFDALLRGMQQEVIAHEIIESIDLRTADGRARLSVDTDVSVEDDLHGTDMYVTLDGVTFPVDIKASWRTAQNTRRKSRHPKSIMTTSVNSHELQGAFHCNPEQLRRAAPSMLKNLYAARAEFLAHQHQDITQTHALAA
jgi:hypothetical protein